MTLTSTHWGAYHTEVKSGRLVGMHPFQQDSDPSDIGRGIIDALEAPSRINQPAIRKSWLDNGPQAQEQGPARGSDSFVEVSWETANKVVADELKRVIADYGNSAIYAGSYGWASAGRFHHAQSQIHRFLNCIGGYTRSVNSYSFAAAEVIIPHVLGDFKDAIINQTDWQSIINDGSLFVGFGGTPIKNGQINQGGTGNHIQRAQQSAASKAGIEFINISPLASDMMADLEASWMPIRPNTDTALMLALCYVLYDEGLHNRAFLDSHCQGFSRFADYLSGRDDHIAKTPQWASSICGLGGDDITLLARQMARQRTMISLSWSLTRQAYGEQPIWAGIVLAAMLGQIGLPGGGIGIGYSAVNRVGHNLESLPFASVPQGINPVSDFIPVARITDMLLTPGAPFDYNGGRYKYPDTKLIYWAGGNPFHHHQDLSRLVQAWQKPQTVIAHEWCWNGLAKHADIVLPVTTTLERRDLGMAPLDNYLISMEPAIAPIGGARDDYQIFSDISQLMGVEDNFTEGRTAEEWQRWLYDVSRQRLAESGLELPSYSVFRTAGWHKLPEIETPKILLKAFRDDPQSHKLKTPSGKIEIYSQTIAGFDYDDCPGHPVWREPPEWLGQNNSDFPLHLISNQPRTKLHSQLDQGAVSAEAKIKGREVIFMHNDDAKARGLIESDIVEVYNARGRLLAGLVIIEQICPGVVLIPTGAWFDPAKDNAALCKHGNPNMLSPDLPTSRLSQGPAAHSCLVEVGRIEQTNLPEITAFTPPEIITQI